MVGITGAISVPGDYSFFSYGRSDKRVCVLGDEWSIVRPEMSISALH